MKDVEFGRRLKKLRENAKLKQTDAARMIGISYSALQNNEAGQYPNQNNLQKYINFYKCSKDWLLTGHGSAYQGPDESTETGKVDEPFLEYHAGGDDFGRAVSGLKKIFDSGDPILTATSMAGIHIFETSLNMKAQIEEQTKKIDDLQKECDDLKERINSLERHIMDVDRRKQVRRQKDLGPPDGVEQRSGLERRKHAAMG